MSLVGYNKYITADSKPKSGSVYENLVLGKGFIYSAVMRLSESLLD